MSAAVQTNNAVMHPMEGRCISIAITAGVQHSLDCSAFAYDGEMVSIFSAIALPMGYKFSAAPAANINIGATSGPTACMRLPANSGTRAYMPFGQNYLHIQSPAGGTVHVWVSSVNR